MGMDEFFDHGVNGAELSFSFLPTNPSLPTRLFDSLKFDSRNSPSSPFSAQFDSDSKATLSNSQELRSPTENWSAASPSCVSSVESMTYFQQFNPPTESGRDSPLSFTAEMSNIENVKHTLEELETALMGPDEENILIQPQPSYVIRYGNSRDIDHPEKRHKAMKEVPLLEIPPGNLKQLLIACARSLSENKSDEFEKFIEKARGEVSINGEPIQRLGAYMIEGLVARKEASGTTIYRTLRCREPQGKDLLSYMHFLYEICPYFKFGYMAANGAIAEACRREDRIHIIDFQIAQGTQWITLLQALAARPRGAPHVRITGIDDPVSKYARGEGLEGVGRRLKEISENFNIPVEFHAMPVFARDVTRDMLDVRPGEALAVNFPMQLHHTPDESVDVTNPRDGLLRMVKSLSPKVVTLVEQESNTNTAPFFTRFTETLNYYLAIFESIDFTLSRDHKNRFNVELHCLARDIVNIVACEGLERVERHELFGKWKSRFLMAGFRQYPLSSYVNSVIRSLVRCYSEHYTLVEKDGAMLLGWKERNLISASAWH